MKKFTSLTAILLCTVWMTYGQWTYTNLSEPKLTMGSAALGNKVYFAGGDNGSEFLSEVQVYDVINKTWEIAGGGLFYARIVPGGSVACGSKVFFAGGFDWVTSFNTVDIYDTETGGWEVQFLSDDRFSIASVSHGDTVMFAGGLDYPALVYKSVVDIYNIQTEEWSTTNLSIAREGIASAVVGNLALFAGGLNNNGVTDRVDIYNFTDNTWRQETLSQARTYASAVTVGAKVIIAGGNTSLNYPTNRVDIYDASTDTWSQAELSSPRSALNNGAAVGGKAYFAGGGNFYGAGFTNPSNVVDIYDEASDTWSVMNLQEPRVDHSVLGVGDYLVVAGGKNDGGLLSSVEIYHHPTLIHVPADYSTIQDGINEASYNDTVLVAEGTYYENINFIGKPLIVASEFIMDGDTNHISNTIINGSQQVNPDLGSVVTFSPESDTTSVLCGFTITGGTGTLVAAAGNARLGGGVLFSSGGKLINNHIENNIISNEGWASGGGVFAGGPLDPLPWVVLRNNRINNNKAISSSDQGTGGGIEVWFNLVMENNQLSFNEATGAYRGDGGGARISGNFGYIDVTISNNVFTHNKAKSNSATTDLVISGGLDIFLDVTGIVSNNVISYNEIEVASEKWGYGTGMMVESIDSGEFLFENNMIIGNSSTGGFCMGGGLLVYDATGKYQNNVIQNNYGTHGGGLGLGYTTADNMPVLLNNTITGNEGTLGGGIYAESADAVVINTIIWDNTAPEGASIYLDASTLEVRYSDVQGDEVWPGEGNVNCSPAFLEDGYHLDFSSQLLNAGITTIEVNGVWYNCPALDIDGEPRPFSGTQPEIGVDELQTTVSVRKLVSSEDISISIFPNPANRMVTISAENGSTITRVTIYDTKGQPVYTGIPVNNALDVSTLLPGVYILEVWCGEKEFRQKLIIQ